MMHERYPEVSFSDAGREYLRTGHVVPFDAAKHATIAALGFTFNAYPVARDIVFDQSNADGMSSETFALGAWGRLVRVSGGLTGAAPAIYAFNAGADMAPHLIRYPEASPSEAADGNYRPRTAPTYLSGLGVWVFVEQELSVFTSLAIYSSRNGRDWEKATYTAPGANFASVYSIAGSASCLYVGHSPAGGIRTISRLLLSDDRKTVAVGQQVAAVYASGTVTLTTAGPDDVIGWMADGASTYRVYGFNSSLGHAFTQSCGFLHRVLRSSTGVIVVFDSDNGRAYYGPSVSALQVAPAWPSWPGGNNEKAAWTGGHFAYSAQSGGTGALVYSPNGAAWTTLLSANSIDSAPAKWFKNHVVWYDGSAHKLRNMVTGVDTPCGVGGFGWSINSLAELGGAVVAAAGQGLCKATDGLRTLDLTYVNATTDAVVKASTKVKAINGRLFAIQTVGGVLLHSGDGGASWTSVAVPCSASVADVEFLNGRWVIVGTGTPGSPFNAAHSADLIAWTGFIMAGGYTSQPRLLLNLGTHLLAAYDGQAWRRSADGINWSAVTGSPNGLADMAGFAEGGTAYVFARHSTAGKASRLVSTDGGATWSTGLVDVPRYGAINCVPCDFVRRSGKVFCLMAGSVGAGNGFAQSVVGAFVTTDKQVFPAVRFPAPVALPATSLQLFDIGGRVFHATTGASWAVVDAAGAGFIGTDTPAALPGQIGYMRVK